MSEKNKEKGVKPQELVAGQFHEGARFDKNSPATVPPPPPGYAPNPVQTAVSEGKSVMMTQKKTDNWFGDGNQRDF